MRLELIIGCMFAGKTHELIRRAKRLESIGKKVLMINSSKDTRGMDQKVVRTHDGTEKTAIKTNRLCDLFDNSDITKYDALCIDEGQFYHDLYEFIESIETVPITVIISGLDGDKDRKPFRQIVDLIPMAEKVDKLHALEPQFNGEIVAANYSVLLSDDQPDEDGNIIGGANKFRAVSRETYLRLMGKLE